MSKRQIEREKVCVFVREGDRERVTERERERAREEREGEWVR